MNHLAKQVYKFGKGIVEGNGSMGSLLGGKGAGLAEMTLLSVPVPPGLTITTDVCRFYLEHAKLPVELKPELTRCLLWLQQQTGKSLGDGRNPLLVSVRSGAPISMPGMMDTVLNVGLNDQSVQGLAQTSGSQIFALDSYRRLLQMFGSVVLGVSKHAFEEAAAEVRAGMLESREQEVSERELTLTIDCFKKVIQEHTGSPFPQDPAVQLFMAVEAVFRSWRSDRAVFYRKLNGIADTMGTAVTVQAMVFGNRGMESGTGVGFTRNPSNGAPLVFGEYLPNAQGEDIVAGIRTPLSISQLADTMPNVYFELLELTEQLERHYKDAQDFEFTVEEGKLFLLQTRAAKRSGLAAVKIAVDMANEGLISREEALNRVSPAGVVEMLSPQLDLSQHSEAALTTGLPASPGAAVGRLALSANAAVTMHGNGDAVILLTEETTADDIHGMDASVGFLTARGGSVMFTIARTNEDDLKTNAAANGQFFLIRRDAYTAVGGHGAVRDQITEDVELMRRLKMHDYRTRFCFGDHLAATKMHATFSKMVHGWGRIYSGSARRRQGPIIAAIAFVILAGFSVWPAMAYGINHYPLWTVAAVAHWILMSGYAALIYRRTGQSMWNALLFPFGQAVLLVLFGYALRMCRTGRVFWRDTHYASWTPAGRTDAPASVIAGRSVPVPEATATGVDHHIDAPIPPG